MSSFASALLELSEVASRTVDPALGHSLTRVLAVLHDEMRDQVTKAEFRELQEVLADLAQAQRRTEQRVEELAEAQRRTEQRVEELAEAQRRTEQRTSLLEQRMAELAEAQRHTDERLAHLANHVARLTDEVVEVKKELGGLSHAVGYGLENLAYRTLPALLRQQLGLEVEGRLLRRWLRGEG